MGIIISDFNQKGGVAKTTTTINLGWALISKRKKVLMVDFDPQGHLSIAMQIKPEHMRATIYDVLNGTDIYKAMLTDNNNFYFLPCNKHLAAAEDELKSKQFSLKKLLDPIKDKFDYIIIDCPPSLGSLSINALVASDYVLVPIQTDFLAWCGFEDLMDTYRKVKTLNPDLDIIGLLATMHTNTNHSKEILEIIQSTGKAFNTVISHSVKFKDSTSMGIPIIDFDKKLGEQYLALAEEVMEREKGKNN